MKYVYFVHFTTIAHGPRKISKKSAQNIFVQKATWSARHQEEKEALDICHSTNVYKCAMLQIVHLWIKTFNKRYIFNPDFHVLGRAETFSTSIATI